MRLFCMLCLSLAFISPCTANVSERTDDKNSDGEVDTWIEIEGGDILCLRMDTNYDGRVDYLLRTDMEGEKIYEEADTNHDGGMDDFHFYTGGVLVRRELDSNQDGAVDIWVYLYEGVYIQKYARDTDYDGIIDKEKDYTPESGE